MDIEMGNSYLPRDLIDRFADAGLRLQLAREPIAHARGAEVVFQMDIRRTRAWDPHSEYYVAWPGADDNVAVVPGVDRAAQQLVMMVHEPKRWFWEEVPWHLMKQARRFDDWRGWLARQARVKLEEIHKEGERAWLRHSTDERKRHFLAGRDERQLFMCRLPRAVTTVAQAHAALRVPEARPDARSVLERSIRQGEWFFVPAESDDVARIEAEIRGHKLWVWRRASIGSFITRAGKPHIVDELVDTRDEHGVRQVFARGQVRHVDHKTLRLSQWYRVYRNREVDEARSPFGGTWID
jgi:hypothetical protein